MIWYTQAYESGYRSSALSYVLAFIYDEQGKTSEAINFYKEAIEYDSTIVDIYTRLGELIPGEEGNVYRAKANQITQ